MSPLQTLDLTQPVAERLLREALGAAPERLDLAALSIATLDRPALDVAEILHRLDGLARRVSVALLSGPRPASRADQITAVRRVLVEDEGLRGNEVEYHDPANSFIDVVLERRVGLPISLSVVWIEVARRAGIALYGVAFPGHFLVALGAGAARIVVDPFGGGRILGAVDCATLLTRAIPNALLSDELFAPASVRTTAWRMLQNLKSIYLGANDELRAARVENLLLQLRPDDVTELRERAELLISLGAHQEALRDLERVLRLGAAPDRAVIEATIAALRSRTRYRQ